MPIIDLNNFDLIFIGTGIHFGNPNKDMVRYLKTTDLKQPKSFAVFVTWGGAGKNDQEIMAKLTIILDSRVQKLIEDYSNVMAGDNFHF